MLKVQRPPAVSRFWLWWLAATIVGTGAGMAIAFLGLGALLSRLSQAAYGAVIGAVFGAAVGISQWLVLRRYLDRVGGWVVLTLVGWVIFWELNILNLLGEAPGVAFVQDFWHLAVFGGLVGVLQWLLLRRRVQKAAWWLLASMFGAALGAEVADGVNAALHSDTSIDFLIGSIVWAYITGVCMMWLLQESPAPKAG